MLTSLLLVGVGLAALLQVATPAPSPAAAPPTELRVTCFNLRNSNANDGSNAWRLRKQAAMTSIRNAAPDILGVQELLEDMRLDLVAALPEYNFVGVAREDGKAKGEYAGILLKRDRFDVIDSGTFWLSPTPTIVGSVGWDASLTRVCTWAIVRDRNDAKRSFAVINAHFDHLGVRAREESAKLLVAKADELKLPAIVMGDFNTFDDSPAYASLAAPAANLIDSYRVIHPTPSEEEATYHGFVGQPAGKRIDYIFVRGFDVRSASIDRAQIDVRWPSDHFPIHAVLSARGSPEKR